MDPSPRRTDVSGYADGDAHAPAVASFAHPG